VSFLQITTRLLLGLLCICVLSCGDSTSPISDHQLYFFEIEYINRAWGTHHNGYVFDNQGKVFAYDHGMQEWKSKDSERVTPEELDTKFGSNKRQATFVSSKALVDMVQKLTTVDPENLSEERQLCADAGTTVYRAWILSADKKTYTPLLLRLEGDTFRTNLSPEADEVYEWLDATVKGDLGNCEPIGASRPQ
jgi:hypothetical protein